MYQTQIPVVLMCGLLVTAVMSGCADTETDLSTAVSEPAADVPADPAAADSVIPASTSVQSTDASQNTGTQNTADSFEIKPLTTSGTAQRDDASGVSADSDQAAEQTRQAVMEKLKPLQVILGQWRGTTRREFEGFKAVDSHEWIWDLRSNPQQPALSVTSDKSPYIRTAKLTWYPKLQQFGMQATDSDGVTRQYAGDFTDPVHEVVGSDDKLHRVFRLELTQTPESAETVGGDVWQIALAQQENSRYLLEVAKRRGSADFRRHDTVSTQREGTSFAISDSDYGEKTCIISQGLGTISVSFKGRTYWVCCSGCKAAFEEDPEQWIARAAKRTAE
ncbi:MAG: hypothetical protein RIK87_20470 [Fuerstiella sp.]